MADSEDSREKQLAYHRDWSRAWRASHREEHNARMREWRANNRERSREIAAKGHKKWTDANPVKAKEVGRNATRKWISENVEKHAYALQRVKARQRNIDFLLTFDEWWTIWRASGKWEQRGNGMGSYCMARYRDTGPYAVGNVRICTHQENLDETRDLRRGIPISDATRKRMSDAAKARHGRGTSSV